MTTGPACGPTCSTKYSNVFIPTARTRALARIPASASRSPSRSPKPMAAPSGWKTAPVRRMPMACRSCSARASSCACRRCDGASGDDGVHLEPANGRLLVRPAQALAGLIEVRGLGIRRLDHEPQAVVGLVVDLAAADAERLPEA